MSEVENKPVKLRIMLGWAGMVLVLILLVAAYFVRSYGYSVDDSYITYRYALHLAEGQGLVFNLGERYYGTTAVGWAVTIALATKLLHLVGAVSGVAALQSIDVPQVAVMCSAISLAVIALMVVAILRPRDSIVKWFLCGLAAVALFTAYPFNEVAGHETYAFLAAALAASVLLFVKDRPVAAAAVFALATSFRPDAVLSIGAALLIDWRLSSLSLKSYLLSQRALRLILVFGALVVAYLAVLAFYFGSPIPGTLAAKKVQVQLGYWPLYSMKVVGAFVARSVGVLGGAFAGLGLVLLLVFGLRVQPGAAASTAQRGAAALLSTALFGAISFTAYLLLNVTFWQWYGVPVAFCLLAAGAAGWLFAIEAAAAAVRGRPQAPLWLRRLVPALPALVLLVLAGGSLKDLNWWLNSKNVNHHISAYTEVADYIKRERPDGAVIQMNEPGSFAYRLGSKFKVVDELGLITAGEAQALARNDHTFLVDSAKPDYLVCSWKGSYTICDTEVANSRFELVGTFNKDFWQPHLGQGARLFRALRPDQQASAAAPAPVNDSAMSHVSEVVLGDQWGKVQPATSPGDLFVHPGAKTPTVFTFDCRTDCTALRVAAHIADLPKDAPAEAGRVGVTVLASDGVEIMPRVVVDRQHPLPASALKARQQKISIKVDNNGDPSFDWLILELGQ
jgi:arabinofuranosyltransferase